MSLKIFVGCMFGRINTPKSRCDIWTALNGADEDDVAADAVTLIPIKIYKILKKCNRTNIQSIHIYWNYYEHITKEKQWQT